LLLQIRITQLFTYPALKNFKIKRYVGKPVNRPSKVTADAMYDTVKIRKYNRKRGIKSNIPVNKRNRETIQPGKNNINSHLY